MSGQGHTRLPLVLIAANASAVDPVSGKSATWQHHRRRRRITFLPSALPAKAPARSLVSIDGVGVATAFLAHDAVRLITGETLYVDGGYHIIRLEHVGLKCRSSRSYRSGGRMAAQARRQADLLRQLDELRTELEALKAAIRARQKAQAELDSLHRERELMRALSAERDPALPLQ
jgi:hypothetical protein